MSDILTIAQAEVRFNVVVDEHLFRQFEIPVISGEPQRQGDVFFFPGKTKAVTPLTQEGFPVVKGENGGNTHALHADKGTSYFDPNSGTGMVLGVLTVSNRSSAVLSHPQHGFMAFGPGNYTVTRQREQADEIRVVAD